jgi:hypothetical protein
MENLPESTVEPRTRERPFVNIDVVLRSLVPGSNPGTLLSLGMLHNQTDIIPRNGEMAESADGRDCTAHAAASCLWLPTGASRNLAVPVDA